MVVKQLFQTKYKVRENTFCVNRHALSQLGFSKQLKFYFIPCTLFSGHVNVNEAVVHQSTSTLQTVYSAMDVQCRSTRTNTLVMWKMPTLELLHEHLVCS